MKLLWKNKIVIYLIVSRLFCSCIDPYINIQQSQEGDIENEYEKIVLRVPDFENVSCIEGDECDTTPVIAFEWEYGDVVSIVDKQSKEVFSYTQDSTISPSVDGQAVFYGKKLTRGDTQRYVAYFPSSLDTSINANNLLVDLSNQHQIGNGDYSQIRQKDFVYSKGTSADFIDNIRFNMEHGIAVLHFELTTCKDSDFKEFIVSFGKTTHYKANFNPYDISLSCLDDMPYYCMDLTDICIKKGEKADLYLAVYPEDLTASSITAILSDSEMNTLSAHFDGRDIEAGKVYHFKQDLSYNWDYWGIKGCNVLSVVTQNGELPTADIVYPPEGAWGVSITNENKVKSSMIILSDIKNVIYDSGEYKKDESGLTIKCRGNTSALSEKYRPYKIKLQKKSDLLFRKGDVDYRDKNWLLLGLNVKTLIGYEINKLVGMDYAPEVQTVFLFINGVLKGKYLLSESIDRNSDCRINVDKKTGYIFERDPYWWNEDMYFNSKFFSNLHYGFTFKYPDTEDITDSQLSYISKAVDNMESSIEDGTYETYIDVESFASWLLGHDILGTSDRAGSNMYFTKYDNTDDSKIKMSALWDFDSIGDSTLIGKWSPIHTLQTESYFPMLLESSNRAFVNAYKQKWDEIKDIVYPTYLKLVEDFINSSESKAWTSLLIDLKDNIDSWFQERVEFINREIENL